MITAPLNSAMEVLQDRARRLLRILDVNHDGRLSVEECACLQEDSWLFPNDASFEQVLDSTDRSFVDADLLWSLLSDRLESDATGGEDWLRKQYRLLRSRQPSSGIDVSKSFTGSKSLYWMRSKSALGSLEKLWEDFCSALQVEDIDQAFSALWTSMQEVQLNSSKPFGPFEAYSKLLQRMPLSIPRFQKQLDSGADPLKGEKLAVIGAGPIGLRAALELALLGAEVHVFDSRASFSRMNILKLWDWAASDLLELGAKHLLPNFLTYIDHIGIRELQALLLKLCLLAKVKFHWNSAFKAMSKIQSPVRERLQLVTQKVLTQSGKPTGQEDVQTFSSLVACDGGKSKVAEHLGLKRHRADGQSEEPRNEIAVVVNFQNHKEVEDRLLVECPRGATSDEIPLVKRLIYLQGETHYFIMTVDLDVLMKHGVVASQDLVNVNQQNLEILARQVVELYSSEVRRIYSEHDGAFGVDIPRDFWARRSVALDPLGRPAMSVFSYHADLTWLSQPMYLFDENLPIFFAGDALREPFWPMGEGCSRGFMGAFDTVWAVRCWAKGLRRTSLMKLRRSLFDIASQVNPKNYGKDVFLPYEHAAPFAGLEWLSVPGLRWPAWGFDGRKRPMKYIFTVDPRTRYISYKENPEENLEPDTVASLMCSTCSK